PALFIKAQESRGAGLGQDLNEKGIQPVILLLMGVMKAFILHIRKNIGLYLFFLSHGGFIGIVYISVCSQKTVGLAVQGIYLFQEIFHLKNIVAGPAYVYYGHRFCSSSLPGEILAEQFLIPAVAAADLFPVFNKKLTEDFFIFRCEKLFCFYPVIRQI